MWSSVDKTVERTISLIKQSVEPVRMDGYVWYDVMNQGLEAEVKLLRLKGELAEHPLIHTLVRFNGDHIPFGNVTLADCPEGFD